jgi:hypothetical protein
MAWNLRGSTVIPCWDMMNPNRMHVVTQNTHFSGFILMLYFWQRSRMIRRSSMCWYHFLDRAVRSSK